VLKKGDVEFSEEFAKAKPLVVVGDYTSARFFESGVKPHVVIVDGRVERREFHRIDLAGYKLYRVVNPAGCITPEAAKTVVKAVEEGGGAVLVDGEEDLLALPAMHALPESGLLVYGQPGQGYVVVRGGPDTRKLVEQIIKEAMNRT